MYDSWASCCYCEEIDECIEDSLPYNSDFEIISEEKILNYGHYKDFVNYDFVIL